MSENDEILSKNGLLIIGITSVAILIVGLILLALGYNEAFYSSNSGVRAIFEIITFTGKTEFFIILIVILFFVYDKRFTKNLIASLLLSVFTFSILKDIFQDPRPSTNISNQEEYGMIETDYGFPSGHALNAVTVWGYIAYEFKDKSKPYIVPVILSVLIFLNAISRIIIGVHDLQDIIGGLIIGVGFLIAFIYLEPKFSEKISTLNLSMKIIFTVAVSVSLFLIGTLLFPTAGLGLVENSPKYSDAGYYAIVGGASLGFFVGYVLENEYVNYQPSELKIKQKIFNLILGLALVLILYLIFGLLIHGNVVLRFIRYALLAFVAIFFIPLIFTKINRK